MFDQEYLQDAAQAAAHYLRRDRTCEIAYTPGNGTLYELILIPAEGMASIAHWMDHPKARSFTMDRPELVELPRAEQWILLAWVGHGCWPVDLGSVWSAGYFAEKYADATVGDGDALRALLLEVSDRLGFRRLQVAS